MPFKWVCNKSAYDGLFYTGYQRCKHKGFETPGSYKQHLWSKKDSDGHPTQAQLDAYEEGTYVPPKGFKPYGLWNPETNEVATTSMSLDEMNMEMVKIQKERMLTSAREEAKKRKESKPRTTGRKIPSSEEYTEDSAESVRSSSALALRIYEDEGEESEELVEDAPMDIEEVDLEEEAKEKEEDLERLRQLKAQPERAGVKKSLLEKEDVKLKQLPMEATSKAAAKPKPQQKASGFTHGGYSIMAQQLIQQKTEQLEHMRETYNYLIETHPAKESLGETIKEVEAAIGNIKKERAKTRPRSKAYSSRQEADKKVAGGQVAYIKERQRKRAVEHRLKTRKERAMANVARQEEAERRFNRPKYGKKEKVFPLAEGELANEEQAAPMHRREKAFIKDDEEEMPEIKQRKMEVPPSEKERNRRKRKEENKKRRMKKEEDKLLAKLKKEEKQKKEVAKKPKSPQEPDHPPPSHRQSATSSRDRWGRWSQEEWDRWNAEKRGQHWKQKSWRYWTSYVQPQRGD